jgi:hypothetical protein
VQSVKILAADATLGGTEGNGFRITGISPDPDGAGLATPYQVAIGECDLANLTTRNVKVSFNDFTRPPTQAGLPGPYVSVQICDFSQAEIYGNLLRGFTVAGVHVVAAEANAVTIRENTFEPAIGSPDFIAAIVDRQTLAPGTRVPFATASVRGNTFRLQGVPAAVYARPGLDLTPTAAGELGGEGTILKAFFNNTITPTPIPGFVVCGRQESLAGAPGNLLNFLDRLDRDTPPAPFTSTVFGAVSDALCSAVGFGPGASLQFRPGGAPPATPTPTPTPTPQPAGVRISIPGLPANAVVTVTGPGGNPLIARSTSVDGEVAIFQEQSITIPFGGQIRVTPAIPAPRPITVGGTAINTFDNETNPGSTTYFNFGPAITVTAN